MARYTAGMTTAGAGTAARPVFAVLATSSVTGMIREISLFNTTNTACTYRLVRFTGGTAGTDQAEAKDRANAPPALCLAKGLWTADATVDEDLGYRCVLGAAAGSGMVFTMGGAGIEIALGSTKGIGLVPVGTGQVCEAYIAWDE